MALLNRKELYDRLSKNVVDLYFTKVSGGHKRKMKATLLSEVTGENPVAPTVRNSSDENGVFTVYDIESDGWRSFRIENLTSIITPSLGEVKTTGVDNLD